MKLRTSLAILGMLFAGAAHAQLTVVSSTVYYGEVNALPAVYNEAGQIISTGSGFVAVGTFTISDTQIQDLWNEGNVAAILDAWVQFGSSESFNGMGGGLDGTFSLSQQTSTPASGLGNKPAYTLISSSSTLSADSELLIFSHGVNFPVIEPPSVDNLSLTLHSTGGTLLVGGFGNYTSDILGSAEPAFNTVAAVPEPSTYALLGLGALAGFVAYRRRR